MKFGFSDCQLEKVDLFFQQRAKSQADIDPHEVGERRLVSGLEAAQRQLLQPETFLPEVPVEGLESDGCAGSSLVFVNNVLPSPRFNCGRMSIENKSAEK